MLLDFKDFTKAQQFIKDEFWKTSPLPNDYIKRKEDEEESSISADFVISRNGITRDIEFETVFQNELNSKYKSYFEASLKKVIRKLKWSVDTYKNIPINTYEFV